MIHRHPHGVPGHVSTPIEETLEALHDVVRAGKALYLGASSMFAWQFVELQMTAEANGWTKFISMQNHYNLVYREEEREMIPLCIDQGVGVIPWSPLARGLLTGSRTREDRRATARAEADPFADRWYSREEDFQVVDVLLEVSEERGEAPAVVALAWMLSVPGITSPIIGSTKVEHIAEATRALEIELTAEELEDRVSPRTMRR